MVRKGDAMEASAERRIWRCGRHVLDLRRPLVMGILNVTPDSFSDGGLYADRGKAIEHGMAMARAGADIIDVGGESTRPGALDVAAAEEISRVCTVIGALALDLDIPLSVDTRHAGVAEAALAAGATIINDISGFRDREMVDLAAESDAGLVVMHMLGEPATMQDSPAYADVVAEVSEYLLGQATLLEQAGVAANRIALDPGIGFGKTSAHNLELQRRLPEIASLGYPVLIGASRKRFIGELTGQSTPTYRKFGSIAAALWAASHGADIVRVHDVKQTIEALHVWQAIDGGGS
jgi:dihydropteroate synthase